MADAFREYIGDVYVQDGSTAGTHGSICWAPVYYTNPTVNVVRPLANDPAHPDHGRYTVHHLQLAAAIGDARRVPYHHRFPDRNLKLELGEDLVRRPGQGPPGRRPVQPAAGARYRR